MEPSSSPSRRVAVLIDGDNAQAPLIENILAETSRYGLVTIRRVYGDWTEPTMRGWKETLQRHAIQPIQQFRNTTGKNATDSALIIDAMDLLYEGVVNAFCLVSSDSDYTRLATRIREKGLFAMGVGRRNTPRAFISACEVFVYTENLTPETRPTRTARVTRETKPPSEPTEAAEAAETAGEPLSLLKRAVDMATEDAEYANLGSVGNMLRQLDPSFDPRTYGHRQLSQLVKAFPDTFEVTKRKSQGGSTLVYVKPKY